jgi:hypothetical protein
MSEIEIRGLRLKMFKHHKEDSSKQMNHLRKLIMVLDKKVSATEYKFSKEMEIMKKIKLEC